MGVMRIGDCLEKDIIQGCMYVRVRR